MQEGVRLDAGIDSSFQIDITMLCIDEASTAPSAAASLVVPPTDLVNRAFDGSFKVPMQQSLLLGNASGMRAPHHTGTKIGLPAVASPSSDASPAV